MPNRREFLQTGAAMSAIVANGLAGTRAEARDGAAVIALGRAVYDDRYAEGRQFAAAAQAHGVRTRALDYGDVTALYHELDELWRREPTAVAGFTQFGPMLVVERLALERGMRVAMRVEHCAAADGSLLHRVASSADTAALAAGAEARYADWPAFMATLACRLGGHDSLQRSAIVATPGSAPPKLRAADAAPESPFIHYYTPQLEQQGFAPALDGPLYSWVVAPRAQRG